MSGRHPWNKLFEETFSPEQRARIIRDADKLVEEVGQNEAPNPQSADDSAALAARTHSRAASTRSATSHSLALEE